MSDGPAALTISRIAAGACLLRSSSASKGLTISIQCRSARWALRVHTGARLTSQGAAGHGH